MPQTRTVDGLKTEPGNPYLYGATLNAVGCNFALFSHHATDVTLLLFDHFGDDVPSHTIPLDRRLNKTGDVWHVFIHGVREGQLYGYIVDGPYYPEKLGYRFNANKLLMDPYTRAVGGTYHWNKSSVYGYKYGGGYDDLSFSMESSLDLETKSVVVDDSGFDWEGDKQLLIPMKDTIIYESHLRSLTMHPASNVRHPGTYLGVIDIIPYLKDLGITTLELLPVQGFNEQENFKTDPLTGRKLVQYWGYSTLSFFAPTSWYASDRNSLTAVKEFKEMVKALHKAGIEVILDVVYNHTGEGNEYGPTLSFRGIDNSVYYMLDNGRRYQNYSGCGNTLNCNHPVVRRLILDSLRYWVVDMHVDGFRFDLAAILGRDEAGNWLPNYSILSEIARDPILSSVKVIAEGWDAAGLYTVGGFPPGWAEWNGKFRDDVRAFVKSDPGKVTEIAKRITGSQDLFEHKQGRPYHSINFVTAHDGFTLNDLVSYNSKHNENNGENNTDGENNNLSWNCGCEGDTDDPRILEMRDRQMKNFFTLLMVSQGTPMIHAGDEFKFSKKGNNNTYCQDNHFSWIDWGLKRKNRHYLDFCKYLIAFRKAHPSLRREQFFTGRDNIGNKIPDVSWHGLKPYSPDWSAGSRVLAFLMDGSRMETGASRDDNNIYVILNLYWEEQTFELPEPSDGKRWYISVDTGKQPGYYPVGGEIPVERRSVVMIPRSVMVLIDK